MSGSTCDTISDIHGGQLDRRLRGQSRAQEPSPRCAGSLKVEMDMDAVFSETKLKVEMDIYAVFS